MPVLLIVLLVGVLGYMWVARRGSTLTRLCRWRLDRTAGADTWRCAACGALTQSSENKVPRQCLRRQDTSGGPVDE